MISFVIPVYNKGDVLFRSLSSLITQINRAGFTDFEIVIVNDGSTDNSFTEAKRFKRLRSRPGQIKIFHYTKNIGKGFALRFGFYKTVGETVVFLDGDIDIKIKQVIGALHTFANVKPDMVLASKYHPASRIFYPRTRFLYSVILKYVIRVLFNLTVTDTQVGLKIFRREVLSAVLPKLVIKRFAVDLEMLVVARMLGFTNIYEVPVHIRHTSANHSSVNIAAVRNFCIDIAAIWYRKYILRYYAKGDNMILSPNFHIQTA